MTPVVLFVWFCAAMGAVAVAKFVLADERDPVDAGVILIVWGITVLAALWTALEEAWLTFGYYLLLGVAGLVLVGSGVLVMSIYWYRPIRAASGRYRGSESTEPSDSTERDADGERP